MNWHQKEFKAVLAELDVPIDGLRSEEAGKRLATYGRNELVEKGKRSLLAMVIDQFRDFMILILIAAAVVSGFVGELVDTIAILVIVLLNAVIGVCPGVPRREGHGGPEADGRPRRPGPS